MRELKNGDHFGVNKIHARLPGVLLTEVEYTAATPVPWHCHEHAHFSFFLKGTLQEVNRKAQFHCSPGTLIFNNSQEPHCNTGHTPYTRHFHAEVSDNWFERYELKREHFQGSFRVEEPQVFAAVQQLYCTFRAGAVSDADESCLVQAFGTLLQPAIRPAARKPAWVSAARDLLHDSFAEPLTLHALSAVVQVHPVHLSQQFPAYFGLTFSQYLRKLRVMQAARHLLSSDMALTKVGYLCGFSDQSHFIRCFRLQFNMTPLQFRKLHRA